MNLYLSSYRLGNNPEALLDLVGDNRKVAVVVNALDHVGPQERESGMSRESDDMRHLGLQPEELDLRDYFDDSHSIDSKLSEFGIVWACGGNSFLLRQAMKRSGFDRALTTRLRRDDGLVYAGYSAGVVVLGPTLRGLEIVDDATSCPTGYEPETAWDGLGLVPFCIAPHFESDHRESEAISKVVDYYKEQGLLFRTLHDGEALVIHGDTESLAS